MAQNHSFMKTIIVFASKDMVLEFFQNRFNDPSKKQSYSDIIGGGDNLSFKLATSGLFKTVNVHFELSFGDSSGRTRLAIKASSDGDAEKAVRELIKDLEKQYRVSA